MYFCLLTLHNFVVLSKLKFLIKFNLFINQLFVVKPGLQEPQLPVERSATLVSSIVVELL